MLQGYTNAGHFSKGLVKVPAHYSWLLGRQQGGQQAGLEAKGESGGYNKSGPCQTFRRPCSEMQEPDCFILHVLLEWKSGGAIKIQLPVYSSCCSFNLLSSYLSDYLSLKKKKNSACICKTLCWGKPVPRILAQKRPNGLNDGIILMCFY